MMPENFADYPDTIGMIRSDKSGKGSDWTPRDALLDLLRDIDSGKIKLKSLVIAAYEETDDGVSAIYRSAASSPIEAIGIMELCKAKYFKAASS